MIPMQKHLRDLIGEHGEKCQSAVLKLQKFAEVPDDGAPLKPEVLQAFCSSIERQKKDFLPSGWSLPSFTGSMERRFTMKSGGRLLVNHSGGVIENSNLCLHRLFGFPMIPGSALKGVARSAALAEGISKERMKQLFGSEDKEPKENDENRLGSVVFLPAFPANTEWKMVVDVLTSHHDSESTDPTPVCFPALEAGATFIFTLRKASIKTSDEDLADAEKFLRTALTEIGVGAKTAAGYGWFMDSADIGADGQLTVEAVKAFPMNGLEERLDEFQQSPLELKKAYLERMCKDKASLIRKWQRKQNPKFEKISKLAQECGMELPLL